MARSFFQYTDDALSYVDSLDGHAFEFFCADLLRKNGFHFVTVTKGSGDQGVDIIATKDHQRYAVQCKHYSSRIGNKPIQEVTAGRMYYNCDVAIVLTNSTFTQSAHDLARATNVQLWDRSVLIRLMQNTHTMPHHSIPHPILRSIALSLFCLVMILYLFLLLPNKPSNVNAVPSAQHAHVNQLIVSDPSPSLPTSAPALTLYDIKKWYESQESSIHQNLLQVVNRTNGLAMEKIDHSSFQFGTEASNSSCNFVVLFDGTYYDDACRGEARAFLEYERREIIWYYLEVFDKDLEWRDMIIDESYDEIIDAYYESLCKEFS